MKKTKTKVENLNGIVNQFKIRTDKGTYFQSYNSVIVFIDNNGNTFLDVNKWDYSSTTVKYRDLFLSEKTKDTQKKINTGEYKLIDLN